MLGIRYLAKDIRKSEPQAHSSSAGSPPPLESDTESDSGATGTVQCGHPAQGFWTWVFQTSYRERPADSCIVWDAPPESASEQCPTRGHTWAWLQQRWANSCSRHDLPPSLLKHRCGWTADGPTPHCFGVSRTIGNLGFPPQNCDFLQVGLPTLDYNQNACRHCDVSTFTCLNHRWAEAENLRCVSCSLDQKPTYTLTLAIDSDLLDEVTQVSACYSLSARLIHSVTYVGEVRGMDIVNDLLITILSQSEGKRLMKDGQWRRFADIELDYRFGFPHKQWHAAGLRSFDIIVLLPNQTSSCRLDGDIACVSLGEALDILLRNSLNSP